MSYSFLLSVLLSISFGLTWRMSASIFYLHSRYENTDLLLIMFASPICITALALSVSAFGLFYSGFVVIAGWLLSTLIRQVICPTMLIAVSGGALIAYLRFGEHRMRKANCSFVCTLSLPKWIIRSTFCSISDKQYGIDLAWISDRKYLLFDSA